MGKEQFRARTGCLTCRDRHVKCDEALPRCRNCCKSNRVCERGIRLNFINIQTTSQPLTDLPLGTQLVFHDESRAIASGYTIGSNPGGNPGKGGTTASAKTNPSAEHVSCISPESLLPSVRLVTDHDEGLLMEVFIEKVGPWMDCLMTSKPFTNITPFYALGQPVLYSAIMACGARYLMPTEESVYYRRACEGLQLELVKPNSDILVCVTTSLLLTSHACMGVGIHQSLPDHTAAAMGKAHVSGGSPGLAGACFWSYTLQSLLNSLVNNARLTWDPESLKTTLDADRGTDTDSKLYGDEDLWTRRMIYICAKVAAIHVEVSHDIYPHSKDRLRQECERCKSLCVEWASNVPRSMMPLCYIPPPDQDSDARNPTRFPHVLFVKSPAAVARLLYHTSCLLLARIQAHHAWGSLTEVEDAQSRQIRHATDICGIASQAEDKNFSHVAVCCLPIAAQCLVEPEAIEEARQILDRIAQGTPWRQAKWESDGESEIQE